MAFYEDLSYPEIAELLDIPVNTVKTRVYYAKQQLKKGLKRQGVTEKYYLGKLWKQNTLYIQKRPCFRDT